MQLLFVTATALRELREDEVLCDLSFLLLLFCNIHLSSPFTTTLRKKVTFVNVYFRNIHLFITFIVVLRKICITEV
jgi:hypothetical protein